LADSALADSAFADSAFTDSTFADSTFANYILKIAEKLNIFFTLALSDTVQYDVIENI
jgi:hypothetical protein